MVNLRYKVNVEIPGLKKANIYLRRELTVAAYHIGDRLQEKIRSRQRKDTGQERRRTIYKVSSPKGGLHTLVRVSNNTIQGNVDETGAKPHFPPYKQGSKLFSWVLRKGLASKGKRLSTQKQVRRIESVSFLIARAISRRGLPSPDDVLRKPFETTRKDSRNMIQTIINFSVLKAVKRVNDEGK